MPLSGTPKDEDGAGSAVRSRRGYEAETHRIGFPPTYVGGLEISLSSWEQASCLLPFESDVSFIHRTVNETLILAPIL